MHIDDDTVRRIADLAHLELTAQEAATLRRQLESILGYVALLDEVDPGAAPPTEHTIDRGPGLRDDVAGESIPRDDALGNAPDAAEGHFRVPPVLE